MYTVVAVVLICVVALILRQRFNNFVLIARNVTWIHEILINEYAQRFPDEDTLLATCGAIDALAYFRIGAFSAEDIKSAVSSAKIGECCLAVAYRRRHSDYREWFLSRDNFLSFVLQLEAMIFYVDTPRLSPDGILGAVVTQRETVKRAIERTKAAYAVGKRSRLWHAAVLNFMTSDEFEHLRNEIGLSPTRTQSEMCCPSPEGERQYPTEFR